VSPPPPTQLNPNDLPPEVKDGLLGAILGGLGMAARMLLSTEPVSLGFVVRRFLAASITAMFVGLATKDHFQSTGLWLATAGGSGYAAPEVTDYLIRYVKAKGEAKIKEAKGRVKTKSKRGRK